MGFIEKSRGRCPPHVGVTTRGSISNSTTFCLITTPFYKNHPFPSPADIIIEVSHPLTLQTYSQQILSCADLFIGSPTAIADPETEASIKTHANTYERRVFIGRGALFAADDIKAMSDSNTLKSLTITMTKHPSHLHVLGGLIELRDLALKENRKIVLYEGPVRGLCEFAPKNVNTMATASFAASCLGLDKVVGRLVADPAIGAFHQVFIEIEGPMQEDGRKFTCVIDRMNPATMGQVTGKQTYRTKLS